MGKSWKRLALVVGIIIAGTSITAYTNHYITKQEQMYAVEDIAETIPEQILEAYRPRWSPLSITLQSTNRCCEVPVSRVCSCSPNRSFRRAQAKAELGSTCCSSF